MGIFVRKQNLYFHSIYFLTINNNLFILYFSIIFFCAYVFDFQLWDIMFIIHRCVPSNAGHCYLAIAEKLPSRYGAGVISQYTNITL